MKSRAWTHLKRSTSQMPSGDSSVLKSVFVAMNQGGVLDPTLFFFSH